MNKLLANLLNFSIKLVDLILFLLSRFRICFFLLFLIIFYFKYNYILVLISPSVGIIIIIWSVHSIINSIKNKTFTWQVFFIILFFFSLICIIIFWDNYVSNWIYSYNIQSGERQGVLLPWEVEILNNVHLFKRKWDIEAWDIYFLYLNDYWSKFEYGAKMFSLRYVRPILWFCWSNFYRHFDFHILRPIRLYIRNPIIDFLYDNPLWTLLRAMGWKFHKNFHWIIKYVVWRTKRSRLRQRRIWYNLWKRRLKRAELRGRRKYGHRPRKKRRQWSK